MNIADDLRKLQEMHRTGGLTDAEFAAAKAAVLAKNTQPADASDVEAVQARLRKIELENELARIDKDWEQERGYYTFYTQYGPSVPGPGYCVSIAIVAIGMGSLFSCLLATTMEGHGPPWVTPLFFFSLPGLGISAYLYYNWSQYEAALHAYEERRAKWRKANDLPKNAVNPKDVNSGSTDFKATDGA